MYVKHLSSYNLFPLFCVRNPFQSLRPYPLLLKVLISRPRHTTNINLYCASVLMSVLCQSIICPTDLENGVLNLLPDHTTLLEIIKGNLNINFENT